MHMENENYNNENMVIDVQGGPYNVLAKPFYLKTDEEFDRDIQQWAWDYENSEYQMPFIATAIGGFLLKQLASFAAKKILGGLYNKIFPGNNTLTMEQILAETEKLVKREVTAAVRDRVKQELVGLQRTVYAFNQEIETFEGFNNLSPELQQNEIKKKELYGPLYEMYRESSGLPEDEIVDEPRGIIESANALNLYFEGRLPQFSSENPEWKIELLPLFAQAANLHILFLRDVVINATEWGLTPSELTLYKTRLKDAIKNHSNHCIATYKNAFESSFPNTTFDYMLDFRNFMVFNVLDYVGIWSNIKYQGLVINSSENIYYYGTNKNTKSRFPLSYWPILNRLFHGKANKILSGTVALNTTTRTKNIVIPGLPPIPATNWAHTYNFKTNYYGGIATGIIGAKSAPSSSPITPPSLISSYSIENRTMSIPSPVTTPLVTAAHLNGYESSSASTVSNNMFAYVARDNKKYSIQIPINYSSGYNYNIPDYTIKNIAPLPRGVNFANQAFIDINGPTQNIYGTDRTYLETAIATFNRTIIQDYTSNYSIKHRIPVDTASGKALGFTIAPFHCDWAYTYGTSNGRNPYINEQFGNNGDSLAVETTIGTNGHSKINYKIRNNSSINARYNVYLRTYVSTYAPSNGTARISLNVNGSTIRSLDITQSGHEGINDNI
ncbi:hypothetical protein COA09_29485 [Bacillus cereus]|nr:hypothetical protein COA09_29485 [Bacillus cereus]PGS48965.1 hypothetical protein COC67_28680 [Bacillus cereus]PGU92154.1 hypothetical protein COD77_29545 [Bacillus cereus]